MKITNTDFIANKEIVEVLDLVKGNVIQAKHIGKDISAVFKQLVGGEIREYTEMLEESRQQSVDRMIKEAEKLGADAVIGLRFGTSQVMQGAAEMVAYGTAVKFKKK